MKIYVLFGVLAVVLFKNVCYGSNSSPLKKLRIVVEKYAMQGLNSISSKEFTCPALDGVFPADDQCTGDYYLCIDGVPYLQHCPGVLIFDVATSHCVMPSESSCVPGTGTTPTTSERTTVSTASISTTASTTLATTTTSKPDDVTTTTSTTITSTTTPSGEQFECPSPNGNFPIPDTCGSEYYVCIANYPYQTSCPNGQIFDPQLYKCVPPNEATCGTPFVCPLEDGFFAIPGTTCSHLYYICIAGVPYMTSCPENLIFDPVVQECLPPDQVACA